MIFNPTTGIFADAERIRAAANGAESLAEILQRLDLRSSGTRYAQLRGALTVHGIGQPARDRVLSSKSVFGDRNAVKRAVTGSRSQKDALDKLGLSLAGKNYARLVDACAVYRLPVPQRWGVLDAVPERPTRWRVLDEDDAVRAAVYGASSWRVAAQRLWPHADARDARALQIRGAELGISPNRRQREAILADREAVTAAAKTAQSVSEALRVLGLPEKASRQFIAACEEYGLRVPRADRAAMARIAHEKNRKAYRWGRPEDVLRHDPSIPQRRVRNMVLRYDLIPYVCAVCSSPPEWQGTPLTLILDHVNGDPTDHRLENLRFVCPNCESQLPTHGSRNAKMQARIAQ